MAVSVSQRGRAHSNNTIYYVVGSLVIAVLIIGWFMYGGAEKPQPIGQPTERGLPGTTQIFTDPATGCQYLGTRDSTSGTFILAPYFNRSGRVAGCGSV